jgi:hypothetical protein
MGKILFTGAILLTASAGAAFAQGMAPTAGSAFSGTQTNLPLSAAGANNNNNSSAAPVPGPSPAPHPGEMVLRFGGRVNVQGGAYGTNMDSVSSARPPAH